MREILREAFTYAKKPFLQHPRLYESFRYLYEFVFGRVRRMERYVIKGFMNGTSNKMTMLYVGTESSAHQLASLIYAQVSEFLPLGEVLLHQTHEHSLMNMSEIVAYDVQRPFVRKFSKQGYLLLPNVNFTLDTRVSMDEIMKRMSRRRRRDIRKINSLKYSYSICRNSNKDFDFFYRKMYLPYVKSRFGKAATIKPQLEAKNIYESNGGIIFVKKNEKPLAGILFNIQRKTLHAWSFGAHEGDQRFVEELAGEAALLFLIEWAKTQDVEKLDYGVSLPFLQEGIFTYKKEWGMNVNEQRDNSIWAFKVNPVNECSLAFLRQNPLIVIDEHELKGVVFIDHRATRAELQQIRSRYYLPNLHSLIVISYFKPHPEATSAVEPCAGKPGGSPMIPLRNICSALQEKGFITEVFEL
jgi:hypothetical protein